MADKARISSDELRKAAAETENCLRSLLLLKKAEQLSLFDHQPLHAESHVVHANIRHLASGQAVMVQEHQRTVKVAAKESTPQKKVKKDDLDPNSDEYRYQDRGHVPGSRKELAAMMVELFRDREKTGSGVRYNEVDWDAVEENPRAAHQMITKAAALSLVDWDALEASGVEPGAAFLLQKAYASIAPKPEDSAQKRQDFVFGINALQDRFADVKTVDDVISKIREIREELTGFTLTKAEAVEHKALESIYSKKSELSRKMQTTSDAMFEAYYRPEGRLNSLEYEQKKRTNRGWKPDAELQAKIDGLKTDVTRLRDEYTNWRAENGATMDQAKKDSTAAWKTLRTFREDVSNRNIISHPLVRGFNSLGGKFYGLINYNGHKGSDSFAGHVANARSGKIKDYSFAKEERKVTKASERSVKFQLLVAEKAERIGGEPLEKKEYGTDDLKEQFGLANVQSGNWVLKDVNSAKHHTEQCAMALQDMAEIVGLPVTDVSLNGRLSLAFGARGTGNTGFGGAAAAHYESTYRVINLTKMKGGGCLAHEWFHAMDDVMGETISGRNKGLPIYGTEMGPSQDSDMGKAFSSLHSAIMSGDHTLKQTREITPSEVEHWKAQIARRVSQNFYGSPTVKSIVDSKDLSAAMDTLFKQASAGRFGAVKDGKLGGKAQKQHELYKDMAVAHFAGTKGEYDVPGFKGSKYRVESMKLDGKNHYWAATREMAARAFSSYIEDKIHAAGRENTYLSYASDNKFYVLTGEKPYPEGEERTRINAAFDHLFATIKATGQMKKAIEFLDSHVPTDGKAGSSCLRDAAAATESFLKWSISRYFTGAAK